MFEAVPLNWTLLARNAIIFHSVIWLSTYNQILLIFSIRYLCTYSKSPHGPVKVDLIQKVLSAHSLVFIFLSIMSNMWFRLFLSSHIAHMIFHALFTWFGLFFIVCHTSCVEWLKEDSFLNSSFPQIHSFICIWIIHSSILHFLKKYPGKLFSFFHLQILTISWKKEGCHLREDADFLGDTVIQLWAIHSEIVHSWIVYTRTIHPWIVHV